jgi:UDP-glucose 4-epimerase
MNNYPHDKVLVTGGAGFIGSHLVEALLTTSAHIVILDDFSTGLHTNVPTITSRITVIEGSILDSDACQRAVQGVSCIFHLAADVSVPNSLANPFRCYEINVRGTYTILEAARKAHVSYFVFSSSAAVYGAAQELCDEETTMCKPISPYGMSKLMGEQLCKDYGLHYGIRSICLRYFNVFGARQRVDVPHASFVAQVRHNMHHNKPITLFGDGMQERDFVAVEDVADANLKSSVLLSTHDLYGETINIASGRSESLNSFVKNMHQQFPQYDRNNIRFAPARTGDIRSSGASLNKYRSLLNF